jgi:hypothetical protein
MIRNNTFIDLVNWVIANANRLDWFLIYIIK